MKTISIIGSCVSRDLFNDKRLTDKINVNFYSFQTNIWDMFSEGLNVSSLCVDQIPIENFARRMTYYDLNKYPVIDGLKKAKSDFIMIDLFVLFKPCLKIIQNGKSIYLKNVNLNKIAVYLEQLLENAKIETLKYNEVDEKLIYQGLDKLAIFLKENYEEKNIILHYPVFCSRYWDLNNKIINFGDKEKNIFIKRSNYVNKFTDYLFSLLPKSKKFKPEEFLKNPCAKYRETDDISGLPNPVHLSNKDLIICSTNLIKLLNLDIKDNSLLNLLNDEVAMLNNRVVKLKNTVDKLSKNVLTSLNFYFNSICDLKKCVVLISVKNQCANHLNKFYAKSKLQLEMSISSCQSYVAIVNLNENIIEEKVSNDRVELDYNINNKNIHLISDYKSNITSIMVDGVEYSTNRRGLNFVILDNQKLRVIDYFYCDTYIDENLLISPKQIKN